MFQTEDASAWLERGGAPIDTDDAFDLYAASSGTQMGRYDGFRRGKQVFVSCKDAGLLQLSDSIQRRKFQGSLELYNPFPELGWAGAEYYINQMRKDD